MLILPHFAVIPEILRFGILRGFRNPVPFIVVFVVKDSVREQLSGMELAQHGTHEMCTAINTFSLSPHQEILLSAIYYHRVLSLPLGSLC